jgi:hypothetical protein
MGLLESNACKLRRFATTGGARKHAGLANALTGNEPPRFGPSVLPCSRCRALARRAAWPEARASRFELARIMRAALAMENARHFLRQRGFARAVSVAKATSHFAAVPWA